MRNMKIVLFLLLFLPFSSPGQQMGTFQFRPGMRRHASNGLIASWKGNQTSSKDEIQIYDFKSNILAHFGVLQLVPDAKTASVWDVAVKPGGPIAVGVVYAKPGGVQNALLLFGLDGKLQKVFALAPSRGIQLLEFDDYSNIWTLTSSSGDKPPAQVPLLVEYDLAGREIRKLFTRDAFPIHATLTKASHESGYASMGFAAGTLWVWLPGSTDLITVKTLSGEASRVTTGLPDLPPQVYPSTVSRVSDDSYLLAALDQSGAPGVSVEPQFFTWSMQSKQWTAANPSGECQDEKLILGAYENKPLLLGIRSNQICLGNLAGVR